MQVTASAWEPLSALRTLSLSLPRNLSRDSADNVLRACTSLRTLSLQFPAGSVDTAYLARHAERCASLQLLEVTTQRMLFTKNLDGGGGSVSGGAGIASFQRFKAQSLLTHATPYVARSFRR